MRKTIAVLALVAAVSCSDDIEKRFAKANAALPPPPAPTTTSGDSSAKAGAFYVSSWDIKPDRTVIMKYATSGTKHVLKGKPCTDDERDYYLDDAPSPLFTAKRQEDAFKIVTPDGRMRWKVKIDGDKIKVSDNDQNANAYVLRTVNSVTTVTAPDGRVFGRVTYEDGKNIMRDGTGKVIERMTSKMLRPAYGLLLIDGLAPNDRFVMLVELIDLMPPVNIANDPNSVGGTYFDSWNIKAAGQVLMKYAAGLQNHQLHGARVGTRREYHVDSAPVSLYVVPNAKGFVIQSANGANRWTVADDGKTITLTGGDKDQTWEIVSSGNEASVIGPSSLSAGTVKFQDGDTVARDANGNEVDRTPTKSFRPMFGVLLMDGVPPAERYVLIAELIARTL
jgi:hypothetical protein